MYTNLNYIRPGKNLKKRVMRSFGYIARRAGVDGEKIDRILFGHGGPLTQEQAERLIVEAPRNTYYWRFKISPDIAEENKGKNLDLWDLTQKTVEFLEKRLGRENIPFIGAEHNDHTRIPHVHAILLIQRHGREMLIDRATIDAVQQFATEQALYQQLARHQSRPLEPVRSVRQARRGKPLTGTLGGRATRRWERGARPAYAGPPCPKCPGKQGMAKDWAVGKLLCPACGFSRELRVKDRGMEVTR